MPAFAGMTNRVVRPDLRAARHVLHFAAGRRAG